MRVLVTGGAGFIGARYVRGLLRGDWAGTGCGDISRVTVLDKLTYSGNLANLAPVADDPRLRVLIGDSCDAEFVLEALAGHDLLVNLAAESHVDRSIGAAVPFVRSNVLGTQVLLDAARYHGLERVLHVSTDEVYGSIDTGSWTERQPLAPRSPYAASKAAADLLVTAYHRTHGLPVVVTRCCNNYGPYQHPEKVIPRFVTSLLDGLPVPLYGDGGNIREWLHVDDHCAGLHLAATHGRPGEIYHLGGGTELSNLDLTARLLRACDADWELVRRVPDRKGHDWRYSLDSSKARRHLGYLPRVDFDAGLAETIGWYRDNRDWWEPNRQPFPADVPAHRWTSERTPAA